MTDASSAHPLHINRRKVGEDLKLSLCMIVKNEAEVLARCLSSAKNIADEIVIVDTGSSDTTNEIAGTFTDRIFDFPWCDDFSAARNFAFSKARGEYIFWLDADDVIENEEEFLKLKEKLDADAIFLPYHTAFDESGKPTFSFYRERIVKRACGFLWKGRVHETIEVSGKTIYLEKPAVFHRSVKKEYSKRNFLLYEKQLAEEGKLSLRDCFYYGRELYYHGEFARAVDIFEDYLKEETAWKNDRIEAAKFLGKAYRRLGKKEEALFSFAKSFAFALPRAEICCEMALVFEEKGDLKAAVYWYQQALLTRENLNTGTFFAKDMSGYFPAIRLCVLYDRLGEFKKAEAMNELAGKFKPEDASYLYNKRYFRNKNKENRIE
ncbi:MAG: glycosyltransferase family 2 protein [Clostridiales bacterium]|nr:glycosyltransferase family 2 protein [Clostridiales bacterium]